MDFDAAHNNSILVAQSISKLVEKIESTEDNEYLLKQLKLKCFHESNVVVSLTANQGLILLVEKKILPIVATLTELVSALPSSSCHCGITTAACDLLVFELVDKLNRDKKYKSTYNLRLPQHPLISVFNRYNNAFNDILSRITYFYNSNCDRTFYGNELFFPFYMYIICNPTLEVPELYQSKMWNFIIRNNKPQSLDIMPYIFAWLQTSTKLQCLKSSCLITDLLKLENSQDKEKTEFLILWLTSLLYDIINHHEVPHNLIYYLREVIIGGLDITRYASYLLTIIAKCILICPSFYLSDLLVLCKVIIARNSSNDFSKHLIKFSLLQWLAHSCILTENSVQLINEILFYVDKKNNSISTRNLYSNKLFNLLVNTNHVLYESVEMNILSESITDINILNWLKKVDKIPGKLLKNLFHFFAAIYLYDNNSKVTLKIIEVLLKIASSHKECTVHLLTLFLYHISQESNSEVIIAILKALPKMAILKENISLVLNTLESLKTGTFTVKLFSVTLLYDLWQMENQCYPNLLNAIGEACNSCKSNIQWRQVYLVKANILREICIKKPEAHGREMVGHLSDILNKCRANKTGGAIIAMVISSIQLLCRANIISITSTWTEISPYCNNEKNDLVIKNLCELMTEVAYCEPNDASPELLKDVLTRLWKYALQEESPVVNTAAFTALSCFTLESVSSYLPEKYQIQKLRSDVYGFVQGKAWLNILSDFESEKLNIVGNFFIEFVRKEISQYRSGTYKIPKGRKEPQNLDYLPSHSIVRELGNYLRIQVQHWKKPDIKHVYLQCLRIMSQKYSKAIPPTDWCFLQELIHDKETRPDCITLATHQLQLSGTARRLIENYLAAVAESDEGETIKVIFQSLKYLCNSIQPIILQPFVTNAVNYSLGNEELAATLIDSIQDTIKINNVHEPNKLVLSNVVVNAIRKVDINKPLFSKLLECVTYLPARSIDDLITPQLWNETENFKLSVQIRQALILKESGLWSKWLKDLIDFTLFNPFNINYIFENIFAIMEASQNSNLAVAWVIELLGHVQSLIANENISQRYIEFLCDIFIISMVTLAGQNIYFVSNESIEPRFHNFPQSVAFLIKMEHWSPQATLITEWLFYMSMYNYISQKYKLCFYQTLAALRYENTFAATPKWAKYMGIAPTLL